MGLDYKFQLLPHLPVGVEHMSVLNLGAGHCSSPISEQFKTLQCTHLTNVEVWLRDFTELQSFQYTSPVTNTLAEARAYVEEVSNNTFDIVIMIDVLEHFTKEDGLIMIAHMQRVSRVGVCIFLPMKDFPQGAHEGNPWQRHLSTWFAEDFKAADGWQVEYHAGFHMQVDPPADAAWVRWTK